MKSDVAKLDLYKPEFVHQFNILLYLDYLEEGMKSEPNIYSNSTYRVICVSLTFIYFISLLALVAKARKEVLKTQI